MKLKLSKANLKAQVSPLVDNFKRYHTFLFLIAFLGIYAFLVIRVSSLTQNEPSPAELSESLGSVKRLQLDQDSIDKLEELEEQNIKVQSLFEQARDNPFTE